jgi:hypothetical protein
MFKKILATMCLMVFGTSLCMAQSTGQSDTNNWGKSIEGVQLSITLTNTGVVEAGSSITFVAVIKNSSTNVIEIGYTALSSDYSASLTSVTGKTYQLIDEPFSTRLNLALPLNPGEQDVRIISASVKKSIEPGDYTLQADRGFYSADRDSYIDKHWLIVKSNLIKIQVK